MTASNIIDVAFKLARKDFLLDARLTIPGTGVTAIIGPSGCGKTSMLRAMAGLETQCSGHMLVGDKVWQNEGQFRPPHQRSLGYVFQEASLFEHLDVRANVQYGYKRISPGRRRITLEQAVQLAGIEHLLARKPLTLSGGERQRVALARALACNPRIMLMDEPLAALDSDSKREIIPCLESIFTELKIPVIYVSHSADEVARLADQLVLMEQGRVVASGPVADLLTRLDLPLAQDDDAEALISANVAEHDQQFDLTYLDFAGGRITVKKKKLPIGHPVRLRVSARDVSLTLEKQAGTSILNIFPAIIDEMSPLGDSQMTVRLLAGGVPLLSRVTRKSVTLLDLHAGKQVYAQAKSVALLT
jgi:molybdate transport system ATP-binding protein